MNNANAPAMPLPLGSETTLGCEGLTKREIMAMHILNGLLSDPNMVQTPKTLIDASVKYADALLAELVRTNETSN